MLIKLDKETLKLIDTYKKNQAKDKDDTSNKLAEIRGSYFILRKKLESLEKETNFINKLKIKRDLKDLLKSFRGKKSLIMQRMIIINANFHKLILKYNAREESPQAHDKRYDERVESKESFEKEEASTELKDKIARVHEKVKRDREINGIECKAPVQTFTLAEIREQQEREKRIAEAIEKRRLAKQQEAKEAEERQKRIEKAIVRTQLAKKRRLEMQEEDARVSKEITAKIAKIMEAKEKQQEVSEKSSEQADIPKEKKKRVLKYSKEKRRKMAWYTAIPVVGALAISTISGAMSTLMSNKVGMKNTEKSNSQNHEYLASVNPSENNEETKITGNSSASTTTFFDTHSIDVPITTEKQDEAKAVIPDEEKTADVKEEDIKEEKPEESVKPQEPIVVNIGDKINVADGLKYTATCLGGGKSNKIGAVSWRPATEYSIDRVAFCYEGKVLGIMNSGDGDIEKTLNNYATQYKIDVNEIDTSVLLSLVPGYHDTGWAHISIQDMQQNKAVSSVQKLSVEDNTETLGVSR